MIKYISIFWLVLRGLLVARKENLTGFSTGLTGRSKNLDPTGNPTGNPIGRSNPSVPVDPTGFNLCSETLNCSVKYLQVQVFTVFGLSYYSVFACYVK